VRRSSHILSTVLLVAATGAVTAQDTTDVSPSAQKVDKVEIEKVRLLLLDVVVVDIQGRTVPDLGLEDFVVVSRRRERPIDTLDVDCPAGRAEDASGVRHPSRRDVPAAPQTGRKIVLALDYQHLWGTHTVDVLEQAKDMIEHGVTDDEEIMVVALTGGLRIEQPFTRDREKVVRTLHRMEYDVSLWNGNFTHMNESGWVDAMTTLLDVLGTVPGKKAVVLYSTMISAPLDLEFQEIAAIAGASRCSIYPVDASGLRGAWADWAVAYWHRQRADRPGSALLDGSLTSMARLAVDTGGRFTESTNDLTLGYARAQRDMGCVYTLGLYIDDVEDDKVRDIVIRLQRPGLHAIHPAKYVFRSPEFRRESLLRAAWISPELFQNGVVRAHLFPLRPESEERWEAVLAVDFPVPLVDSGGQETHREFGVVLRRGPRVVHRFNRRVTLRPESADVASSPLITFLQPTRLRPGDYTLTVVMSDPAGGEPATAKIEMTVPEIPTRELFLVGPILGRRSGTNVVVMGSGAEAGDDEVGDEGRFQPLLVRQIDKPTDLVAFTQACLLGSGRQARKIERSPPQVERVLKRADGEVVGALSEVEPALEGEDAVLCGNLVDVLPTAALPNGEYVFEASVRSGKDAAVETVRFSIGVPSAD